MNALRDCGVEVGVLAIDTLARNFGGGDPDKSGDMSRFVESCGWFARTFAAVVLAVHHPGKDAAKGPRNSYALTAGADTQILIKAAEEGRIVEVEKQRDGRTGASERFRLEIVDLGPHPDPRADDDERLTSCVAIPVGTDGAGVSGQSGATGLTNDALIALKALSEALGADGEIRQAGRVVEASDGRRPLAHEAARRGTPTPAMPPRARAQFLTYRPLLTVC